jgi:NAD(P)-dependent dehydrogenase (short-subunit alcohol dehydrogenase family)
MSSKPCSVPEETTMRTILITGVSSGLGRAFAEAALNAGNQVVGTVRKASVANEFEALAPGRAHARLLDVTDDAAVFRTVADVESSVGPIDAVIANAGYGLEGIFEETPLSEVRAQFETNVLASPQRCRPPCRTCESAGPDI